MAWPSSHLETFLAKVSEQSSNMGGRAGAEFEVSGVQAFLDKIPEVLRPWSHGISARLQ